MGKPKSTKTAAAWSLVILGAGFAATLPFQQYGWARLLAGAFEAGLVGDWQTGSLSLLCSVIR